MIGCVLCDGVLCHSSGKKSGFLEKVIPRYTGFVFEVVNLGEVCVGVSMEDFFPRLLRNFVPVDVDGGCGVYILSVGIIVVGCVSVLIYGVLTSLSISSPCSLPVVRDHTCVIFILVSSFPRISVGDLSLIHLYITEDRAYLINVALLDGDHISLFLALGSC